MASTIIQNICKQLSAIQDSRVWLGANFSSRLTGINDDNAFIRPHPQLKSVAELIAHISAWQKEAVVKINTKRSGLKDEDPANWLPLVQLSEKGWAAIRKDYEESLSAIIDLLEKQDDSLLDQVYFDIDFQDHFSLRFAINGLLQHSVYHLGQLSLVVKFLAEAGLYNLND